MLTATNIMDHMESLELGNYKTIDQFLFAKWGIDYDKLPFYHEIKSALENTMKRIDLGNGNFQWVDKY